MATNENDRLRVYDEKTSMNLLNEKTIKAMMINIQTQITMISLIVINMNVVINLMTINLSWVSVGLIFSFLPN